jgi:hypothetical protein
MAVRVTRMYSDNALFIGIIYEPVNEQQQIDYMDQDMLAPLDLSDLAQGLSMEDEQEVAEDRLERQARDHLEAAARHRDDPMF